MLRRQIGVILLCVVFIIIYISNRYSCQKKMLEIDRLNILQATRKAMREAAANIPADLFLIDAVTSLGLHGREMPIIHGDAVSYSIAAASIVAKVTRDHQMIELDQAYPEYGFLRNKGYGTKEHIEALKRLGPCPEHRKSFIGHFWP